MNKDDLVIIDDNTLKMLGISKEELDDTLRREYKEGEDYVEINKDDDISGMPNGEEYFNKIKVDLDDSIEFYKSATEDLERKNRILDSKILEYNLTKTEPQN